jgi:hypothetical protein
VRRALICADEVHLGLINEQCSTFSQRKFLAGWPRNETNVSGTFDFACRKYLLMGGCRFLLTTLLGMSTRIPEPASK